MEQKRWIISLLGLLANFVLPYSSFSQFTITPTIVNSTCSYDSSGSISILVSGGAIPYTYLWSPGGETSSAITGLMPGTYAVTITDNSGADSIVSFVVVAPPPIIDSSHTVIDPACTNDGRIVLLVSGGTPGYQYAWSNGSPNVGITELWAGDYSVLVTDANNCTATFNFSLTETECFVTPTKHFTPNDDGINDTWSISNSQYFPDAKIIIFNRWGSRVYEHKGLYESWDGKSYLGVPVPDAVYYYFFYQDKDDKQKAAKSGSVTIIR